MNKMYTIVSRKYVMAFLLSVVLSLAGLQSIKAQTTLTYSTGGSYTFTVPSGVTSIAVKLWGGGGAGSYSSAGSGGSGAFVKGTLTVTPGQTLTIVVGDGGLWSTTTTSAGGNGGGGTGGIKGGAGGGYSGIFNTSATFANALVIAGGGGGGGYASSTTNGGAGGATSGTAAGNKATGFTGGGGGTISAGGSGGSGTSCVSGSAGSQLTGGAGGVSTYGGGGGGGGYYGGGGGYGYTTTTNYNSGGGGGSSYVSNASFSLTTNTVGVSSTTAAVSQAPGNAEAGYVTGAGNGGASVASPVGTAGEVMLTYTCSSSMAGGTYSVGPTATYATITAAIAAMQTCGIGGPVILELNSTYVSTSETFPINFGVISGVSATNTITVRPATGVTSRVITSANTTATINLNGNSNIIFDGRPAGSGTTSQLTIANTSTATGGTAIQFINGANNNTIKYVTLTAVYGASGSGIVNFSTTTGTGNSNNTIDNCTLDGGAASTTSPTTSIAWVGILSSGTTTSSATYNSNNTISNNKFKDIYYAGGSFWAMSINAGSSDWTISGNSVYQSASRTQTTAGTYYGFFINTSGNNFNINGNYIGGGAVSCGGSAFTIAGSVANKYIGIYVSTSTTITTTASSIQNNTIANLAITSSNTSAVITGPPIFHGIWVLGSGNVNVGTTTGNTIGSTSATGNITLNAVTTTGGVAGGISSTSTGTVAIANNNIAGITLTGGSTTIALGFNAIWNSGAAASLTINNNTIGGSSAAINISTAVTVANTITGILNSGACTALNIYGNTISSLTSAGTLYGLQGISSSAGTTVAIYQNNINTITQSAATGAHTVNAITISGGTTISLYKNKIYGISSTSTGATVNGVNVTLATTVNIYNNVIGGLTATAATGLNAIVGINASATATYNVYFNNIVLNATSAGATFGTSCIYFGTTGTLNLRNNILVNTSVPGTAASNVATNGVTAILRRSSGTAATFPSNYASTSNKNLFWVNPAGGTNNYLTYVEGVASFTNAMNTFANWKTFATASSIDQNSFAEQLGTTATNLSYLTLTGSTATSSTTGYLRIVEGTSSQSESGADVISSPSITDDYGSFAGNRGTFPDVGAWEFAGVAIDLSSPTISYTALTNTGCTSTGSTLSATITDASGVNTTSGTKPRLYYKKSTEGTSYLGNTSANNGWKYVEATNSTSPFTFPIDYTLLTSSVAVSDIIQYFVVAQDNAGTANVGIKSNTAAFTLAPSSVALTAAAFPITGTPNSFTIVAAGLSGNYTIGASGKSYTTLTTASTGLFADINSKGLSGNTTVTLDDASITETGATALNAISYVGCAAGPYTLTIKPKASTTVTLTGSIASAALIKLNGVSNVTIDGSNAGSTSQNLTITNTSATSPTAISIANNGTIGSSNCTIKNCIISTGSNAATSYGIAIGGSTPGSTAADNDNITIQNNSINTANYGIYAGGTTALSLGGMDGLIITANSIGSNTSANYVLLKGIYLTGVITPSITSNTIFNIQQTGSFDVTGIDVSSNVVNGSISGNTIYSIYSTSTSGYGAYGLQFSSATGTTGTTVANNIIYDIKTANYSTSSTQYNAFGIRLVGGTNLKLYNNSVNLYGTVTSGTSAGMSADLVITSTSVTGLDLRNNIFVNTQTFGVTGSFAYNVFLPASYVWGTTNFNDYYGATGTNTTYYIGYSGSANVASPIANWKTITSQDASSVSSVPNFISNTDLHINNTLASPSIDGKGTSIAGITTDYDGDIRNGSTPDIGADEFTLATVPTAATISTIGAGDKTLTVNFSGVTNGGAAISNYKYSTDNGTSYFAFSPAQTATPLTITKLSTDGSTNLTNGTSYSVIIKAVNGVGDGTASNMVSQTPYTVPATPTGVTATATGTSQQVSLSFTAPASNGNAIDYYTVTPYIGVTAQATQTGTSSPITLTGLTNGTAYTFTISAHNAAGSGSTATSLAATPYTTPSAANITSVDAGNNQLTVNFTDPVTYGGTNGGSTITNYQYSTDGGTSYTACSPVQTTSPIIITGLTNGQTYSVKIQAINNAGAGTASNAVSGTPVVQAQLTASVISGSFGAVTVNTTAGPQSFTFSGIQLDNTDVVISGPSAAYTFSTSSGGTYNTSLTFTNYGTSISTNTVYVKYSPTAGGNDNGSINISGGGTFTTVTLTGNSGVYTPPSVVSSAATVTSATTVTLNGTVNANSFATTAGFDYGTTVSYGTSPTATTPASGAVTGSAVNNTSVGITGLSANTTYYFRANASGGNGGTTNGNGLSFVTWANTPTAPAVNGATGTTLDVTINANGNPSTTTYAIQENILNTSPVKYVQANGTLGASAVYQTAATWGTVSTVSGKITVTGLVANTGYGFAVSAKNSDASNTTSFGTNASTSYTLIGTPSAPTISNITTYTINVAIVAASGATAATTYAIRENVANSATPKYVQADGTLGASAVYQTAATWGANSGVSGTVTVNGLAASTNYGFAVLAVGTAGNSAYGTNGTGTTLAIPSIAITYTTSTSLVVPAGISSINVYAWGAGGGGGGIVANGGSLEAAAGGGGGGAFSGQTFSVTPSQTLTITVGAAGTAGTTAGTAGGTGGTSSVSGTGVSISAAGGTGGTGISVSGSTSSGLAGAGGAAGSSTIAFKGGNGTDGYATTGIYATGGAGGGGAGIGSAGGNGTYSTTANSTGGTAGTGAFPGGAGATGTRTSSNLAGSNGSTPGGGGSGAGGYSTAQSGGAGGTGQVVITYPASTPTTSSISPVSVAPSSGAFTLTVNGTSFLTSGTGGTTTVLWNGTSLTTTYVSATQVTASVPAGNVTTAGTAIVTVKVTYTSGGAIITNSQTFTILPTATVTTTTPPTAISNTAATMAGAITAGSGVTAKGIVYAVTATNAAPQLLGTGVTSIVDASVGTSISGATSVALTANTQYTYAAYATNPSGTGYGAYNTFYTYASVPSAPTLGGATYSSLQVGIVTNGATKYSIAVDDRAHGAQYVQADGSLGGTAVYQTAAAWGANVTVTGLGENTPYDVSVSAQNAAGVNTAYGSLATLTTSVNGSPLVSSAAVTVTGATTATINGLATTSATYAATASFNWGTTSAYGSTVTATTPASGTIAISQTNVALAYNLTGLTPNTQYHYQAVGTYDYLGSNLTVTGNNVSFYTYATTPSAPTVGSATASSLQITLASGDGTKYAIRENIFNSATPLYVQANGTLGATAVYQTAAAWSTPVTVTGLANNTQYGFAVSAQNGDAGNNTLYGSNSTSTYTLITTPSAPTVNNASSYTLDVTIAAVTGATGYAIRENVANSATPLYVQADGTLGASAVYQTAADWGTASGISGKIMVTGLTSGTAHGFAVSATGLAGNSAFGTNGTGTTAPLPVLSTTYTTSGSWVCPAGVTTILVQAWGGGGGGGSTAAGSGNYAAGGGAGGGYVSATYSVTPSNTYSYTVGAGGAGAPTGGTASSGSGTYFVNNTTIYAVGGNAGSSISTAGNAAGGAKVTTGNYPLSGYTASYYGGAGSNGATSVGGAGGGSAGTGSNGNGYTSTATGTGYAAVTGGGAGGSGGSAGAAGSAGSIPGGGGGGAETGAGLAYVGGTGASGQISIGMTLSTPTTTTISPSVKAPGSAQFTITVNGTNFINSGGSTFVVWNGVALTTTYVSATQVTAIVPSANVLTAGTANVGIKVTTTNGGIIFANTTTFTILPLATVTTTTPPTAIGITGATMAGAITAGSGVTVKGIVYAVTATNAAPQLLGTGVTSIVDASVGTSISGATSVALTANTQYTYAAYATNPSGTGYGAYNTFYTYASVPSAPTLGGATYSSIQVGIVTNGATKYSIALDDRAHGAQYVQADGSLGGTAVYQTAAAWGANVTVTGLGENTPYDVSVSAQNAAGVNTAYGSLATLTTSVNGSPIVSSAAVTVTGATTATINGLATTSANYAATGSFNWGTTSAYGSTVTATTPASGTIAISQTNVALAYNLTGLTPNTQYHYQAVGTYDYLGSNLTVTGNNVSFYTYATTPSAPTVGSATTSSLQITLASGDGTKYAIRENIFNSATPLYVQANGTLGATAVYQTAAIWGATITVTGLTNNTQYGFGVAAQNADASLNTPFGTNSTAYTLITTPGAPTIGNIASVSMDVTIAAVTGASGYAIRENVANSATPKYVQADGTLGASAVYQTAAVWGAASTVSGKITVTGLAGGTAYGFGVSATGNAGNSAFGANGTGTTLATPLISTTITNAGNGTFTVPAGVTTLVVKAWGAGGGGGGNDGTTLDASSKHPSSSGGGGGAYTTNTLTVTPSSIYNYTVGSAGTAGSTSYPCTGGSGGSSFFGNTTAGSLAGASVIAVGGAGGSQGNTTGVGGLATDCTPSVGAFSGGTGGATTAAATANHNRSGGGGGSAAGTAANGNNGAKSNSTNSASAGGVAVTGGGVGATGAYYYSGYYYSYDVDAGTAGKPGGGGGGAHNYLYNGGAGGDGQLVISYPVPTPTTTSVSPVAVVPGSAQFTLTLNGTNFVTGTDGTTAVLWNGVALATTYVSATQLTAIVPSANVTTAGSAAIGVKITATNGGIILSNTVTFSILALPTVTTDAVPSAITNTTATMGGNVTAGTATAKGIVYAVTATNAAPQLFGTGVTALANGSAGTGSYSVSTIAALTTNTQYTYAAYATNASGTAYGTYNTFYTNATIPTAPTLGGATDVSIQVGIVVNGATKYAIAVDDGAHGVQYVQADGTLGASPVYQTIGTWGANVTVTGLSEYSQYLVSISAQNATGINTAFGATASIYTTYNGAPTVTTNAGTSIGTTSVTLNGAVNANSYSTTAGFDWGTTSAYGHSVTATTPASGAVSGATNTSILYNLTGLTPNTQYHYMATAGGGAKGAATGTDVSFYTYASVPSAPTVGGATSTTLQVTLASGNGTKYAIRENVANSGTPKYVQANGTLGATVVYQTASTWGTVTVTGLSINTGYGFGVSAQNADASNNTAFGANAATATTLCINPTISIARATPATPTTVCSGSDVALSASIINATSGSIVNGSGATTEFNTSPYRTGLNAAKLQYLILASELKANGLTLGNITKISFNVTSLGSPTALSNYQISLGNTSVSSLTTAFETSAMTTVYGPTNYNTVLGTNNHTFTTPFMWDGTSNLLVQICEETVAASGSSTVTADAVSNMSNLASGTAGSECTITSGTLGTGRPTFTIYGQVGTDISSSYNWIWKDGASTILSTATGTVNPVNNTTSTLVKTYTVTATNPTTNCSTTISANNSISILPAITMTSVSQPVAVCSNATSANIVLAGLPTSTSFTVTYNINSGSNNNVAVSSDATGKATFAIAVTGANNGQTLTVTNLASTICSQAFSNNNSATLVVTGTGPAAPTVAVSTINIDVASDTLLSVTSAIPSGGGIRWYNAVGTQIGSAATYRTVTADACTAGRDTIHYAEAYNTTCASPRTAVHIITKSFISSDPANGLICTANGSVDLTANINATAYTWTGGSFIGASNLQTVTANPTSTTIYSLSAVTAACGTITNKTFNVGVIAGTAVVPTATSPVCIGSPVQLNSNVSASNFTYSSITYAEAVPIGRIDTLANGGSQKVLQSSTGSTTNSLDDGAWDNIPIGFTYNYFGNTYNKLAVSTNGVIGFGDASGVISDYSTSGLSKYTYTSSFPNSSNPANVIAFLAHDGYFATSGTIRYWNDGVAPTRRFIMEFKNAPQITAATTGATSSTVQCILYESTGIVEIHIKNAQASATTNTKKTIGLQDLGQTIGVTLPTWNQRTTEVTSSEAWRFIPPSNSTFLWTTNNAAASGLTGGNTITNPVIPASLVTTAGNYTYTVSVTNSTTGCVTDANAVFTVNPLPTVPTATSTVNYCQYVTASALTATAASGNTLKWYNPSNVSSNTAYTPSTATAGSVVYNVSQIDANSCESAKTPITVNVTAAPVPPTFTTPVTLCQYATTSALSATASAGTTNTIYWYTSLSSAPGTGSTTAPTPSTTTGGSATTYYVTQYDGVCESNKTASVGALTVNVTTAPATPSPVANGPYCQNESTTALTATGYSGTLNWYNVPSAGATVSATPSSAAAGTVDYYVSQTIGSCESQRGYVAVITNANVPASVSISGASSICGASSLNYTAIPTNGGASPTYLWYKNGSSTGITTVGYTLNTPAVNDDIYVVMTSSYAGLCLTNSPATSSHVTLTNALSTPSVSIAASATTICAGTKVGYRITGSSNLGSSPTYQWQLNGVDITDSIGTTYYSTTLTSSDVVTLVATSSASCLTTQIATSNGVSITVNKNTVINSQPVAVNVCAGSPTSFTVVADGTGTINYTWKKGGTTISGAPNAASYSISSAAAGNIGTYTVLVSSACGANQTSDGAATLAIRTATGVGAVSISSSSTLCAGSTADFSVAGAVGDGTLGYQWKKDGTNIGSATSSTYRITNVAAGDAATYSVAVTGTCGSITSAGTALTVNPITTISASPAATVSQCTGTSVNLSVTAAGTGTLSYVWKKNGTIITAGNAGSNVTNYTTATLNIGSLAAGNAGVYTVEVTGGCGSTVSPAIATTVTVNAATLVDALATPLSYCQGSTATITANATGSGTVSYQWIKGTSTVVSNTATLTINNFQSTNAASYKVIATSGCGSTTSNTTVLSMKSLPTPTVTPTTNVCQGSTGNVYTTESGMTGYSWTVTGGTITSGGTSNANTATVTWGNGTSGHVLVNYTGTNSCTAASQTDQTITFNLLPTVNAGSAVASICQGTSVINNTTAALGGSFGGGATAAIWSDGGAGGSFSNNSGNTPGTATYTAGTSATSPVTLTLTTSGGSCGTTSSTKQIVINSTVITPAVVLNSNSGSTICAGSTVTFTATSSTGGTAPTYNFKINGTSAQNSTSATFTSSANPASAAYIPDGGTVTVEITAHNTCQVANTATSNGFTFHYATSSNNVWTGNFNSDFNSSANWCSGIAPTGGSININTVSSGRYPVLSSSLSLTDLTLASGTTFGLGTSTLTLSGTITGAGLLVGSSTAGLNMNSSAANTITFRTTNAADSMLNTLTLSGTGKVTLGSGIGITSLLSLNAAANLELNNNHLTIKSTSLVNTAEVGPVTHGATITGGKVTVERYIPKELRNYRDLGASVANAGGVFYNWQESGAAGSNVNNGFFITGTAAKGSPYLPGKIFEPISGLDYTTAGAPSMYTYNGTTWPAVTNTKTTLLNPFLGYRAIIRGARNFNMGTNPNTMPTATTVRTTGDLVTGEVTMTTAGTTVTDNAALNTSSVKLTTGAQAYSLIANPYACPVQWSKILGHSNIYNSYWYLDPTYQDPSTGYQRYITVQYTALSGLIVTPNPKVGGTFNDVTFDYIQSGQAIQVNNYGASGTPSISFKESDKIVGGAHNDVFGLTTPSLMSIELYKNNVLADAAVASFNDNFTTAIGTEDATKMMNSSENISITESNSDLSIDGLPMPSVNDVIPVRLGQLTANTTYQLKADISNFTAAGVQAYVRDNMLNTEVPAGSMISFTPTSVDIQSYKDRFTVVFKAGSALGVKFTTVKAEQTGKDINVSWTTANETNMSTYEVEKSTNGKDFVKVTSQSAKNAETATYKWLDMQAVNGANYYRIKAIEKGGKSSYSNVVVVNISKVRDQIAVYPNPVTEKTFNLQLMNVAGGKYTITLVNNLGQILVATSINHTTGSSTESVRMDKVLPSGMYTLVVKSIDGNQVYQTELLAK